MKTISIDLYQFGELNEKAKQYAVNSLRDEVYASMGEMDWYDANQVVERIEEISGVKCGITSSSQGWSCRWYHCSFTFETEESLELFNSFKKNVLSLREDDWAVCKIKEIVDSYHPDGKHEYDWYIADCVVKFCNSVDRDVTDYYGDEYVADWLETSDYWFTKDGKLFTKRLQDYEQA